MTTTATILALTSGFILGGFRESPANLIATSLVIDAALAPVTAIIAHRRGRSPAIWAILGFVFGVWALGWVLLFKPRIAPQGENGPTTPQAA